MPGFFKNLISGIRAKSAGLSALVSSENPFAFWASAKRVSPAKAMASYNYWTYACIRAIAEEIANMQWRLFQVKANTNGDVEELHEHEVIDLLNGVNEFQTGYELKYTIGAHLEATGNFYGYLEGVKSATDKPKAIYPLSPASMTVVRDRGVFPNRISAYRYVEDGKEYTFQPYEILHLKYPDPSDPLEGVGTVQSIGLWIDADMYAMEFNKRFFQNGARIGGILESDSARSDGQLEFIKKSFEGIHKGYDSAYKTLILPKGTKYTQASESQKDMDFANLMDKMRDRILAGFRVPRTVLGITDDVNRANAEATNYIFALRTIKPKMELIVSYLNEFLMPRYGENLYLDFEDPVPENTELKMMELEKSKGVLSTNEQRERYFGYKPIENGDDVLIPFNVVPLGAPITPIKEVNQSGVKNNKRPSVKNANKSAKMRQKLGSEFAEKVMKGLEDLQTKRKEIAKKSITEMTGADFEIIYTGFKMRVTNYVKLLEVAFRKLNHQQKEKVLKNLPNAVKAIKSMKKGVDKADLFDIDAEVGITINLTTPALTDLYEKESKEAAELIGASEMDILANPAIKASLDKAIELMARSYNGTTLDLLKAKLDEGIAGGSSVAELTDLVSQIYEYSDVSRAEMIARTESFRIANDSTKQTWRESGVVKTIRWHTAEDEVVCAFCGPMNGKVVKIEDDFFKEGDTVDGQDGAKMDVTYSDVGSPPLHPDCRCYVRPDELVES